MKSAAVLFCIIIALSKAVAQDAITPASHVELFNGTNFDGFTFFERGNTDPMKTWSISNGLIQCTGKPTGYMRTEKKYADFKFTVEWRFPTNMTRAINTGVCVFMQDRDANTPTNLVWGNSIECQGMHDHQGDFWFWGGATCAEPVNNGRNGIKMPLPSAEKPAGEWNTFEVVCKTNTMEIIVNGTSMNKITGCNNSSGYIGLQSEGGPWEARKISIEPLQ
jgi:Domain of Unknown Function (DUF1080)